MIPLAHCMRTLLAILGLLLWPATALADAGAQADQALAPLRLERERTLAERDRLAREQAGLEQMLAQVNQAIASLKALDPVVADAPLETALRKHRELSDRLTALSREQRA